MRIHCVKHGQVIITQYTHSVVKATVYLSFADHTLLVALETPCGDFTAGGCRVGLVLINKTKGWYNGVTYQVSSVLDSLISCCFLHLIRRADSLLVIDHSCREGEGEDDVSLAGGGSGKRDQS